MAETHTEFLLLPPPIYPERAQCDEQNSPCIELPKEPPPLFLNPDSHDEHKQNRAGRWRGTATLSPIRKETLKPLSPHTPASKRSIEKSGAFNGNGVFSQYLHDIATHPVLRTDEQLSLAMVIARSRRQRNTVLSLTPLALQHLLDLLNQTGNQSAPWTSLMEESRTTTQPHQKEDFVREGDSPSSCLVIERLREVLPKFLRLHDTWCRGWSSPGCEPALKRKLVDFRREIFRNLETIVFHPSVYDSLIQSLEPTEKLLLDLTDADHERGGFSRLHDSPHTGKPEHVLPPNSTERRVASQQAQSTSPALIAVLEQDVLHMKTGIFLNAVNRLRRLTHTIQEVRNQLILGNLRLVISLALGFKNFQIPLPDLIQEGNLALMKAVDRFDFRRGIKFSSYATWWIWKAIGRMIRGRGHLIRLPDHMVLEARRMTRDLDNLSQRLGRIPSTDEFSRHSGYPLERIEFLLELPIHELSMESLCPEPSADPSFTFQLTTPDTYSPFAQASHSELKAIISANLKLLPHNEAYILCKRFGLEGHEEQSLADIAKSQEMSNEHIRHLEMRGLRRLSECPTIRELGTEITE
jgi:RNA polymerase primary sigma factor